MTIVRIAGIVQCLKSDRETYMLAIILFIIFLLLGYFLGYFFAIKNDIKIDVTLSDIEKALDKQLEMCTGEEDSTLKGSDIAEVLEKIERFHEKCYGTSGMKYYRVHLLVFMAARNPSKAYCLMKRCLKKQHGLCFKGGMIDVNNVYVEEVDAQTVNDAYKDLNGDI